MRHHHLANGEPQRTKAIARDIAYHGVTLGALSFTGVERFKTPFGRPAIEVEHVSTTNRFRAVDGDDDAALCARLLAEMEETIERGGPRDRRDDHRRADPERGRLPHAAGGLLGRAARDLPTATGSCSSPTR